MFVKPAEGRQVRDPASKRPIPAAGANVPQDSYWIRRLRDGDVVAANPPAAPPAHGADSQDKQDKETP